MKKLLIVLLVLCFAAPAMAADWHFYGSLRTHLGYYDVDQEFSTTPAMDNTIGSSWDDDSGTLLNLGGQSRFGAKAIASENFYGVIEFGLEESTRAEAQTERDYLRLAYGVWNFGAGKLTVGKDYTPGTFLGYSRMDGDIGDSGDANMLVCGLSYIGRQPQIKLSFGDLDIAFIEQHKGADDFSAIAAETNAGATDIDFVLPRIEAAYVFRTELVNIRPVAGFQTYEVETQFGGDEDIDSYLLGIGASFDLKPFYVKATASYLQNAANYGELSLGNLAYRGAAVGWDGDIHDSDLYQGTLVAGMQVNKMLNIEAGFGYQKSELDKSMTYVDAVGTYLGTKDNEQTAYVYYLQAWLSLSKNMHIIPEIGVLDRGEAEYKWEQDVVDGLGGMVPAGTFPAGTQKSELGKMSYFDVNFRVEF